jgi:hypothetical protein
MPKFGSGGSYRQSHHSGGWARETISPRPDWSAQWEPVIKKETEQDKTDQRSK